MLFCHSSADRVPKGPVTCLELLSFDSFVYVNKSSKVKVGVRYCFTLRDTMIFLKFVGQVVLYSWYHSLKQREISLPIR